MNMGPLNFRSSAVPELPSIKNYILWKLIKSHFVLLELEPSKEKCAKVLINKYIFAVQMLSGNMFMKLAQC